MTNPAHFKPFAGRGLNRQSKSKGHCQQSTVQSSVSLLRLLRRQPRTNDNSSDSQRGAADSISRATSTTRATSGVRACSIVLWRTWAIAVGVVFIVLIYIPVLWLAMMSFNSDPLSGIPEGLTWRWYSDLVRYPNWAQPLMLSVCIATAVAAFCMLFFRSYLQLELGPWSIFVGHVVWGLPFSLLLVVVSASRFDHRLIEAALDLGASRLQAFWHIEMPHLRAGAVGAGIFGFLLSFNELLRTLFLRGLWTTLPIYQWAQSTNHQTQVAVTFCLATLIFLVAMPLIAFLFWLLFVKLDNG
jgi:ABC-type spermidine/putrescine transport system permease subunit II